MASLHAFLVPAVMDVCPELFCPEQRDSVLVEEQPRQFLGGQGCTGGPNSSGDGSSSLAAGQHEVGCVYPCLFGGGGGYVDKSTLKDSFCVLCWLYSLFYYLGCAVCTVIISAHSSVMSSSYCCIT